MNPLFPLRFLHLFRGTFFQPMKFSIPVFLMLILILILFSACNRKPSDMILVPGGEFLMGTDRVDSDEDALEHGLPQPWYVDEQPLHRVNLPPFYIDTYEVTNKQYKSFLSSAKRQIPIDWQNGDPPPGKESFPVTFVHWFDADAYCQSLEKRLPTEQEWEKAARGAESLLYPWGNLFDPSFANIAKGAVSNASAVGVGLYEEGKSPYGNYDMIGNVWEWTGSWYRPYPGNTSSNDKFGQIFRVTRGLSFMGIGHYSSEEYLHVASIISRVSFRSYDYPTSRLADVGFRCAKSVN